MNVPAELCPKCGFPTMEGHRCPTEGVGSRHNAGKPRPDLIPAEVIMDLGKHYEYGARKYAPNNWVAGFPYSETLGSLERHLLAWKAGEAFDPESGTHHLTAVIWNAVTLRFFEMYPEKYGKFDDRVVKGEVPVSYVHENGYGYEQVPNEGKLDEDYMLGPNDIVARTDEWRTFSKDHGGNIAIWARVPAHWVNIPYDTAMGPIRRPYRSTQIHIPALHDLERGDK